MAAIGSFPNGSAGSPDGSSHSTFKDMVQGVDIAEDSPFCVL